MGGWRRRMEGEPDRTNEKALSRSAASLFFIGAQGGGGFIAL
jgi:hypothetical protein